MEEINAFVRAAALNVPPPQVQPEDLFDILPRQGKALGGQATFATSGRRITLTAATIHSHETRRPQPTQPVINTPSSRLTTLTTSAPRVDATTPLIPLAPVLPTTEVGASPLPTIVPTSSPIPNQPSPVQPSPIPSRIPSEQEQVGAQSPSATPVVTPGGADAGVIVGAILLVLVGIAILAAVFFFIRKKVNGKDNRKTRAESFDFGPPSRTNPNLSRSEKAAMAELMRIAYRVENEGDGERGGMGGDGVGGGGVSYYPGVPPNMAPNGAGVEGVTPTPYEESRRADNVTRMQSLGSESVAQLGLKHPVGRWVHVQRPGAVAQRTSAYDVPDMPVPNYYPDRYSSLNPYAGMAR